jgi:tyrosine decarboxylase/aspartate 1-decarboxylase
VLADLRKNLAEDTKYGDGKVLSSMCTNPLPIARIGHQLFLGSNLGDAGLFPGSRRLERDVVRELSNLLNCENGAGFMVSGGTEANLTALWAARNRANVSNPEVIVPESAHFSFEKICNILAIKIIHAGIGNDFRANPQEIEDRITQHTVAIVGTAGTSELGVVDPIPKLSEIALAHKVHLHVDAALGGLVIPFLEPDVQTQLAFDFRLDGVKSLTVDPHKMGMSTIPAGTIIFRDRAILECIRTDTPYLTEAAQFTFAGTRSAASSAATWGVFDWLGREGFQKTVKGCMALTGFLSKEIEGAGLRLVTEPTLNIVAFRTSNSRQTADELRKKGWFISYVPRLDCLRIVIMPHLRKRHIEAFLRDLKEPVHSMSRKA